MNVIDIFVESEAILDGHFALTSGRHSDRYLEKFNLLQWPTYTDEVCKLMADFGRKFSPQTVAGPTTGGVLLAYEVARHLGLRGIFCEPDKLGGRSFQRGFRLKPGEKVLVVDDIVTTGGSLIETVEAVEQAGGQTVAIAALADRTDGAVQLPVPFFSALSIDIPSWEVSDCPPCKAGMPLTQT